MQCNILHLQSCTLGDATSVVALMSQAHAWSKMTQLITWATRIIKDSIKEDHQAFIREVIFRRAKVGDPIQGITSTKGVHLISLLARSPAYGRKPLSWRNCWYSSCRGSSHIRRVSMQQSEIWRYRLAN